MVKQPSDKYWKERFRQLEEALHRDANEAYYNIERAYTRAINEIERDIAQWYQRFSDGNDISLSEAKRILNKGELKEFKWTVEEYVKYGKENAINQQWMSELENASARVHINRLDALKLQMQQQMERVMGHELDAIDKLARKVYADAFYKSAFEIQKGLGTGWSFAGLDTRKIDRVVNRPWAADGRNFSQRIWQNGRKLVAELEKELVQGIITGKSPKKTIKAVADKMNVSRQNAERLVMTETVYFSTEAQKDCFLELEAEESRIVERLDHKTCALCGDMDGKVLKTKDIQAGINAPPFHPRCRGTLIPHFDDMDARRWAWDDRGRYQVPADMTYEEWREQHAQLEQTLKKEAERKVKADKLRQDTKQYERYKSVLGAENMPDNIDGFRRMKYNNKEMYSFYTLDYRRKKKLIDNPNLALPNANHAKADDRKFTAYLFGGKYEEGIAKGRALSSRLGYTNKNWTELKEKVLANAKRYPAVLKLKDKYGGRYEQKMILYGNKNKPANVVVGWNEKDGATWLTTLMIKERDR